MLLVVPVALFLVVATTVVHFEAMILASRLAEHPTRPRRLTVFVVFLMLFVAHVLEASLYAAAFYVHQPHFSLHDAQGNEVDDLWSHVYFSAQTYSSLGFGDLAPQGALRLLAPIESLNGLLLIGWSASFLFLLMQKLWRLHETGRESR
jgi:hypothetical protein